MRNIITGLLLLLMCTVGWAEEPLMTMPFKCTTDYIGGVLHLKNSQQPAQAKPNGEEFRLVPRSDLPVEFLEAWEAYDVYPVKIRKMTTGVWEDNTYFIRNAGDDPLKEISWKACNLTTATEGFYKNQIVCGQRRSFPDRLFRLDLGTKKFVSMYLGTWDSPPVEDDYYGNSSSFSYGLCRPYYD